MSRLSRKEMKRDEVLEGAAAIIVSIGIDFPKLRDVEDIAKNHKTMDTYKNVVPMITRGANPNLRGQHNWKSTTNK